ncbi:MAG TPA: transcription antitermination factor NusB [Streptosporangiaceae bacterium]|nr:transcription antitermination factor NusB [Streptosporangiaceae bacterium]
MSQAAKAPPADPARRTAYDVLRAVTGRGAYANLLLASTLRERGLRGQDAALATELVYGTLRNRGTYDAVISLCADRGLDRIDPAVADVLAIGAHQLLGMGTKPHAAVATSVDLAVAVAGRRPSGFVNAILRRIAQRDLESWIEIAAPDRAADPVGHLSVRYSHPRWIVTALAEALGEDLAGGLAETEAALAADQDRPVVTLAAVPGRASRDELLTAGALPARWSPFGAYLTQGDPGAVAAVAQHRAGVQDEASQLAVLALTRVAVGRDHAWLDICAGPGGKARLLTGLAARRGAVLVAADMHEHRARLAAEAIGGTRRAPAAHAVVADGTAPAWRLGAFDRVLADVPCSGLGSLRRKPDARSRRGPDDVTALGPLQRNLLEAALGSARPGGVVAYVTCSPHVAETRDVLTDVLARHADVEVLDAPAFLPEVPGLRCPEPYAKYAQFWPHRHGTDAIFIALLRVPSRGQRGAADDPVSARPDLGEMRLVPMSARWPCE